MVITDSCSFFVRAFQGLSVSVKFPASTQPTKHIEQWWGPKGFTTRVEQMDFRPGGICRYVMCSPDGTEYPVNGVFREVVPPERIVATDEFDEGFEQVVKVDLLPLFTNLRSH